MEKIGITTDCVCDLPYEYLKKNNIDIVFFYITTDSGRFRDGYEITSRNILEYLEEGGTRAETNAPEPVEYKEFFEERLVKYERIIHVSISDKVSNSYRNAVAALELMGENKDRVTVIDSEHLSTGMGHMVMKAVEMRDKGITVDKICEELMKLKHRISTSFITMNADYLHRNGRVSKGVKDISTKFMVHPVLFLKEGSMILKGVRLGNYDKSIMKYVRKELRHPEGIDTRRLFITHAGCTVKMIESVKRQVEQLCTFDEVIITKASATISGNCGPGTVGVLFVKK